jgi:hypothetical protein
MCPGHGAGKRSKVIDRQTIFSPDRVYRYTLWREWDILNHDYAMFIGLNPSTADETKNDPTVRRCIGFAKAFGFGALCMMNLFAFRATKPEDMMNHPDPVGSDNDKWLQECAREAKVVVAAWGTLGAYIDRDIAVCRLIPNLKCLCPREKSLPPHPLYLPSDSTLIDFQPRSLDAQTY